MTYFKHRSNDLSIGVYLIQNDLSVYHNTTVRVQTLTGDEAAVLAGEKDKTGSNFTGLSSTAHWHRAKLFHCRKRHC